MDRTRRSFLVSAGGVATVGAIALTRTTGSAQAPATGARRWDMSWVDALKGKHKQLYDLIWHTLRPNTLNPPMNYFEIHKELSGLEFPDINVVVGINSTAFPINASDGLWTKLNLGERYKITNPATGKSATHNVYLDAVKGLQARGAVFMMCNNSLQGMSRDWAGEFGKSAADMHDELVAGLNPGVKVVPALTYAVGILQEHGFTYEKL